MSNASKYIALMLNELLPLYADHDTILQFTRKLQDKA